MLYFEVISRTAPFGWKILPGRRPRSLEYFYMTKTLPDNFYITRKRQSVQFGWILFRMRGVVWNSEAKRFCPASSEVALHDIARCQMYEKATHHTYLSSQPPSQSPTHCSQRPRAQSSARWFRRLHSAGCWYCCYCFQVVYLVHNDRRPDDFAGFSQCREISSSSARAAPLSRTDWALHAAVPASKLRTRSLLVLHSGTDQKPLHLRCPSFLLGHTASAGLPWSRPDLSYTVCALPTQGLKAPEAHTPSALIRARDKARKGQNFWNPPSLGGAAGLWAGACFCWINKLFWGKHIFWNPKQPYQNASYEILKKKSMMNLWCSTYHRIAEWRIFLRSNLWIHLTLLANMFKHLEIRKINASCW